MKKCNNCVGTSVFIIPPPAPHGDDLLVTKCAALRRGPFSEPFHHLNGAGSNSHDLMRCRMPEICRLCFLFSPPTLFSSPATPVRNGKTRLVERDRDRLMNFCNFVNSENTLLMSFPAGEAGVS